MTSTDVAIPFTEKGLVLPADTSFERWEEIGGVLGQIHGSLPFWIGDWRNLGEAVFGEQHAQVTLPGVKHETELTYRWVASHIPYEDRRLPELTFSHHRLVAALPKRQRDTWLDRAVKKEWNTRDMRANLLARRLNEGAEAVSPESPAAEAPTYTPREALTAIRGDETWRKVADSALAATITCPHCGEEVEL